MLTVAANAIGFFTGSGKVNTVSVDLFNFRGKGKFRVKGNTTVEIYIGHDVLLIEKVHNVIGRNSVLGILTTV